MRGCFSLGRDALWWLASVHLSDTRQVWLPEYCCPEVVRAFRHASWQLRPYRLTEALEVDWNDLMRRGSDEPSGLFLIIDFLGFSPAVTPEEAGFLQRSFQYVLRDSAQGVPQSALPVWEGAAGGFVLFSLRKPLPIPDMALLCEVQTDDALRAIPSRMDCPDGSIAPSAARSCYALLEVLLLCHPAARQFSSVRFARRLLKTSLRYGQQPTRLSWERVTNLALRDVAEARRGNAEKLIEACGKRALYRHVPSCSAPYYFPILVDDPDYVARRMRQKGIETTRLWGASGCWAPEVSEPARTTAQRILCVPVHQGIGDQDMRRLIDVATREVS